MPRRPPPPARQGSASTRRPSRRPRGPGTLNRRRGGSSGSGGVSGLWNPKAEDRGGVDALAGPGGVPLTERERRVGGLDLKLSYIPLQNNQFRSFTWGTEVLYSDNRYLFDPDGSLDPSLPAPG